MSRFEEGVVRGEARARKRRGLLEGEMSRELHPRRLGEDDLLAQHSVVAPAERLGMVRVGEEPVAPGREEVCRDLVADLHARHVLADGDDLPRAVGERNDRGGAVLRAP
jgi:hypothetical protein